MAGEDKRDELKTARGGEATSPRDRQGRNDSDEEVFIKRMMRLLGVFTHRQAEILRLAAFVAERESEFVNAKEQARKKLAVSIEDVDDDAFEKLYDTLESMWNAPQEPGMSRKEHEEAALAAIDDVASTLPKGALSAYLQDISRVRGSGIGVSLHMSSLLVMLVGEVESVIGRLARVCFVHKPEALDMKETNFTWSEISHAASLEELREKTIARAVETLMHGSLVDWVQFFSDKFSIESRSVSPSKAVVEVVQRRNCIVHNAGSASKIYVEKMAELGVSASVGDSLELDYKYLEKAADELYTVVFSLIWALGIKLLPCDQSKEELLSALSDKTYGLIQTDRFQLLRCLNSVIPFDRVADEDTKLVFQVNCWLAFKLDGRFDAVKQSVSSFDVSAKSRRFNLAKHALLDENDEAARCLISMYRDGHFNLSHFYAWPLLRGVRKHMRETGLIKQLESIELRD